MKKKHITLLALYAVAVTGVAGLMTYNTVQLLDVAAQDPVIIEATSTDPFTEYLKEIEERPEFSDWVEIKKEQIYWEELRQQADYKLEELQKRELDNEQVRVDKVQAYLEKRNPALVQYARQIAELPRYLDVLAIAYQETKLCTVGVGEPGKNNCGGIKSHRADRTFKVYDTPMDALEDISYLLHEPHMVGKTIEEMNGIYCVDEVAGYGGCPEWAQNIKSELAVILSS